LYCIVLYGIIYHIICGIKHYYYYVVVEYTCHIIISLSQHIP